MQCYASNMDWPATSTVDRRPCPRCRKGVLPAAVFCPRCGIRLHGVPVATLATAPVSVASGPSWSRPAMASPSVPRMQPISNPLPWRQGQVPAKAKRRSGKGSWWIFAIAGIGVVNALKTADRQSHHPSPPPIVVPKFVPPAPYTPPHFQPYQLPNYIPQVPVAASDATDGFSAGLVGARHANTVAK